MGLVIRSLNTRMDYLYCHSMALKEHDFTNKQIMLKKWKELLESSSITRIKDDAIKREEEMKSKNPDHLISYTEDDWITEYNPNGRIFLIGFTETDVKNKIYELQNKINPKEL